MEGDKMIIKGPRGELSQKIGPEVKVEVKDVKIQIYLVGETKGSKAIWGLTRALIANMVEGVTAGFEKKLAIEGIGFKASVEGEDILLQVGFSHQVKIKIPPEIKISVEKNIINVSGIDKGLVGQTAANIRKVKPPEPYKGKGIRYVGEVIRRKTGKKAVGAGT